MFLVEFAGGDVAEVKVFKNCSCTMLLKNLTDNSGRILQMVVFRRDLVRVKLKKRAARTGGSDVLEITIWLVKVTFLPLFVLSFSADTCYFQCLC